MEKPHEKAMKAESYGGLPTEMTVGMFRYGAVLKLDQALALARHWRSMGEGQSYLMATTFEKCARDLEALFR